jgi:hypothetical protein
MYVLEALFDTISAQFIQIAVPLIFLVLWWASIKKARMVEDVPTSSIRGAAQGYVELVGKAEMNPQLDRQSAPLSGQPCVWYQLEQRLHGNSLAVNHKKTVSMGGAPFIINDGTGSCYVDPQGADLSLAKTWRQGDGKEYRIEQGDSVYVLGCFTTVSRASLRRLKMSDKIDGDTANLISYSNNDRQPYMISSRSPRKLARYYRVIAVASLVLFFMSLAYSFDLLNLMRIF